MWGDSLGIFISSAARGCEKIWKIAAQQTKENIIHFVIPWHTFAPKTHRAYKNATFDMYLFAIWCKKMLVQKIRIVLHEACIKQNLRGNISYNVINKTY